VTNPKLNFGLLNNAKVYFIISESIIMCLALYMLFPI